MKQECPDCGSSDGLEVYDDHMWCYASCEDGHRWKPLDHDGETQVVSKKHKQKRPVSAGVVADMTDRCISKSTCAKYGVTVSMDNDGSVKEHHYPWYNETGEIVATKTRFCADKDFTVEGTSSGALLFGQNTCRGHGKYLTITEGEVDCLSVSEMFGRKYDVVSVRNGSGGAKRELKEQLEFIEGYDNIVLCFDNDSEGQKAVSQVKDLFEPGKVIVVKTAMKDANAMLKAGKSVEFLKNWWDGERYTPDGVVHIADTWDAVLKLKNAPSVDYPWAGLNNMLLGQRKREIVVWGAPTGLGKTTVMREVAAHLVKSIPKEQRVGCLMLEESIGKSVVGWCSFAANRPLHKEMKYISDGELRGYWEKATEDNRIVLLEHNGWRNSLDTLKSRIRYMKHALGCEWIILDHLHIALSSVQGASGDWAGIDELMTEFVCMVENLDIGMHLVAHTSDETEFRGTKGIKQQADAAIFLSGDRHAEGDLSNITKIIVDKSRFAGDVGTAGYLKYDPETGRLAECAAPENTPDEPVEF
jgi:twinkle protein